MGNNVVAVLLTDFCGEMESDGGRIGPDMARAVKAVLYNSERGIDQDFHVGRTISWDHSSAYQVVIVHAGIGWRLGADPDPPWVRPDDFRHALRQMAECLVRHGYKVTKRRQARGRTE